MNRVGEMPLPAQEAPLFGASWTSMAAFSQLSAVPEVAAASAEAPAPAAQSKTLLERFRSRNAAIGLGLATVASAFVGGFAPAAGAKKESTVTWKRVYATCSGGKVRPPTGQDGYVNVFNDQGKRLNSWADTKIGKVFDFSPNVQTLQIPASFVDSSGKTVDTTCAGLNSSRMGMANTYYAIKKLWLNNFGPDDYVLLDLENAQGVGNIRYCGFGDVLPFMPAGYSHLVLSTIGDEGCGAGANDPPSVPPNTYRIDGDAVTMVYMLEQFTPVTSPTAVSTTSNIVEQTPLSRSWVGYRDNFNNATIDPTSLANVKKYMSDPTPPPPKKEYKLVANAGLHGQVSIGRKIKGKYVYNKPARHAEAVTTIKGEPMLIKLIPEAGYIVHKTTGCENKSNVIPSATVPCLKKVDNVNPGDNRKFDYAFAQYGLKPPPVSK